MPTWRSTCQRSTRAALSMCSWSTWTRDLCRTSIKWATECVLRRVELDPRLLSLWLNFLWVLRFLVVVVSVFYLATDFPLFLVFSYHFFLSLGRGEGGSCYSSVIFNDDFSRHFSFLTVVTCVGGRKTQRRSSWRHCLSSSGRIEVSSPRERPAHYSSRH